jgi:pimeloyl-ACP methyl ester carboxylesterase
MVAGAVSVSHATNQETATHTASQSGLSGMPQPDFGQVWIQATEYLTDFAQRSLLFLDVMRQRENERLERGKSIAPHVLNFDFKLLLDGRTLTRPVNYGLVEIVPPDGVTIDPQKRPFVIVDPRAGHGPGIGGFKADSEIGVALRAGHTCYFIGFMTEPVYGQTIEDVAAAEAVFLERVIALNPEAEGKPAVIGNCQAGWAIMLLAAIRPDLFGPIIVAGSPMSYWAGVRGINPMRYSGGLLGGSWLTALTSDLGNGTFDGAWLVQNFENLNPSNTLWTKQYNVFAKVDTEAPRYLEFEKWWSEHVLLTGEEIQYIVDNLFVGNKLAAGEIVTKEGVRVDLRAIRSPIIVFCSKGDNITPPQQALGWILDLYDSVEDIRMHGQTIVYTVHDTVGHLGIFVSAGVARKEHDEFASNIDLIDVLPPGLYEAVLQKKSDADANVDLAQGDYIARFEARTLDHIRALGGNDAADERRFATAARVSEINHGLYRTFVSPWIRCWTNDMVAETMRQMHPLRMQTALFSDKNPVMRAVADLAGQIREDRRPVSGTNPFLRLQEKVSEGIVTALDAWRDMQERISEQTFLGIYGMPALQAAVGLEGADGLRSRKPAMEPLHRQMIEYRIRELVQRMSQGDLREAVIRALVYVGMADTSVDERGFAVLQSIRAELRDELSLAEFKAIAREQFFMLLVDEERAVAGIGEIARRQPESVGRAIPLLRRVVSARGTLSGERERRLQEMETLFGEAAALPKASQSPALIADGRSKAAKASGRRSRKARVSG